MNRLIVKAINSAEFRLSMWAHYCRNRTSLELPLVDFLKLKSFNVLDQKQMRVGFRNRRIRINSPFWFLHGLDEIFVDEVYKFKSSSSEPRIIDCGANIGLSVIYFKQLFPAARLTAFEPDPLAFLCLKENTEEFDLPDVELVNKAVWINEGTLPFEVEGTVGGKLDPTRVPHENTTNVECTRLRGLLSDYVDFLKIDIEGAEYEVVLDCADRLANVENLFIEYHVLHDEPQRLDEILSALRRSGFRYYMSEAWKNQTHPFLSKRGGVYEMQLNISAYRA